MQLLFYFYNHPKFSMIFFDFPKYRILHFCLASVYPPSVYFYCQVIIYLLDRQLDVYSVSQTPQISYIITLVSFISFLNYASISLTDCQMVLNLFFKFILEEDPNDVDDMLDLFNIEDCICAYRNQASSFVLYIFLLLFIFKKLQICIGLYLFYFCIFAYYMLYIKIFFIFTLVNRFIRVMTSLFINCIYYINMKKVRISKKNPARILKAIEIRGSPKKQQPQLHKSIQNSKHFEAFKQLHQQYKHSYHQNVIHSHRYKPSQPSFEFDKRKQSYSPREHIVYRSLEKQSHQLPKHRKPSRGLRDIANRSTEKSPYLQRASYNKSQRRLILSNRNFTQTGRNVYKQQKKFRFNSLQQKQSSLEIKKTSDSQDVLKQAKKLMLAGQSRKSMFILKPLLAKQPSNLNALYVGAVNLYNIGDYQKCTQYLQHILQLKRDFNINVYFLIAKVNMKQGHVNQCLLKLNECAKIFPGTAQVQLQRGQVFLSLHSFKQALQCLNKAEKLDPRNIQTLQKLIIVYQNLGEYQKIIQTLKKIPNETQKHRKIKYQSLNFLKRYQQLIKIHQKSASTSNSIIMYQFAFALYKIGDLQKSYLILESSLAHFDDTTKSVKLMLLINCKNNDFYEANHLKQRCQHLNVNIEQLKCEFGFIEGAICLMKRNTYEGVQKLNQVNQQLLRNKVQTKQLQYNQYQQFQRYMMGQLNMFLGYGYFCLGNYDKSQSHYLTQIKEYPGITFQGMDYNMDLNRGYLSYSTNKLQQSVQIFIKLSERNKTKIQPFFCSAVVNINLYFKNKQQTGVDDFSYLSKAKQIFANSESLVSKFNNNIGANFLYHKSVLYGVLNQWKQAMVNIDEAIQKSQQNYWRYYYLRALILACIHNFSQAINDCTAAISLKESQASPFYLRSCCFQIQGQGNYAFKDLQSYIALRPDDKSIHKFAGKLLFQNGAFEDAIAAFNHQFVEQILENEDVFLTKSKTYFLLGRFPQASQQMFRVNRINPSRQDSTFDGKMMLVLHKLLNSSPKYNQLINQIKNLYQQKGANFIKCQIFKKTQLHTLTSICYFYLQNYGNCIAEFQKAISTKQKLILKQSLMQGATRQDQKDTRLFINQMYYNISICYLIIKDIDNAKQTAGKMIFNSNDVFYQPYIRYMRILNNKKRDLLEKQQQITKIQIFPSRNKISNYLQDVTIKLPNQTIITKLCIPFPKVEPPEIFPIFDIKLLKEFTLQRIQRKSQAPWICRQQSTIKFTNKIQKYSRLQIEQSMEGSSISQIADRDIDDSHMDIKSINSIKSKATMPKLANKISYSSVSQQSKII